jgi:heterotetrameric sarcosine oxidase delta subunit
MGFKIPCPNCGARDVYEFTFDAERRSRPSAEADLKTWRRYLYFRRNACGIQEERWYHAAGCGRWLRVRRDTATNEVLEAGEVAGQ